MGSGKFFTSSDSTVLSSATLAVASFLARGDFFFGVAYGVTFASSLAGSTEVSVEVAAAALFLAGLAGAFATGSVTSFVSGSLLFAVLFFLSSFLDAGLGRFFFSSLRSSFYFSAAIFFVVPTIACSS